MAQEFTQSMSGRIIVGKEDHEQIFLVSMTALAKSPIIKGWIDEPDSLTESMQKDGALYLPNCDAEVIRTLIHYLDSNDEPSSEYDFKSTPGSLQPQCEDPLFYAKVYKLSLSLAVDALCVAALVKMRSCKYGTQDFIDIVTYAEAAQLIDENRFRDWIVGHMSQNLETLMQSKILRGTIKEGGQKAWAICSVLMTCLSRSNTNSGVRDSLPSPPPSSLRRASSPNSLTTARHGLLYAQSPQKSPNLKRAASRGDKEPPSKKRNLNATVEDAVSSDEENMKAQKPPGPKRKVS